MFDKVTKLNTIAKRAAWSKVNQGVLVEHADAYHRNSVRSAAEFKCPNTAAQLSVTVSKRGKLFRRVDSHIMSGGNAIATSWPSNHGVRKARKA
jgi:hypothetical protein